MLFLLLWIAEFPFVSCPARAAFHVHILGVGECALLGISVILSRSACLLLGCIMCLSLSFLLHDSGYLPRGCVCAYTQLPLCLSLGVSVSLCECIWYIYCNCCTPQGTSIYTETRAVKTCQTDGREVRSVSEADARRDEVAELVAVLRYPGATPTGRRSSYYPHQESVFLDSLRASGRFLSKFQHPCQPYSISPLPDSRGP